MEEAVLHQQTPAAGYKFNLIRKTFGNVVKLSPGARFAKDILSFILKLL